MTTLFSNDEIEQAIKKAHAEVGDSVGEKIGVVALEIILINMMIDKSRKETAKLVGEEIEKIKDEKVTVKDLAEADDLCLICESEPATTGESKDNELQYCEPCYRDMLHDSEEARRDGLKAAGQASKF